MRRLGSKLDAIEGTAESLPLMASTGSLLGDKSSNEESQVADMAQPLPRIVRPNSNKGIIAPSWINWYLLWFNRLIVQQLFT